MGNKTINIRIDSKKSSGRLPRFWRYIGYDECNYTQWPEGVSLLRDLGGLEKAPCYVRMHHLLCTGNCHAAVKWGSTNVYSEDSNGNPIYTWETIDEITDILLANNCKPFFELGFMPMDLVDPAFFAGKEEWEKYGLYKNQYWAYPPKDYRRWHELISRLVSHCVDRYGEAEVLTWYWELWNEPDILYWKGTAEEFCKLFDYTEAAVHSILPDARLGGPSTTGPIPNSDSQRFLESFLIHCRGGVNHFSHQIGTRLDFITFHVKGGGFPFQPHASKATPSIRHFAEQVRTGLESIKKFGYEGLEVVLSEADPDGWAAGGVYDNPNMKFRNTEYYASYVAASYHYIHQLASSMGIDVRPLAWAFLFPGERCFEGTRTFATQGIHKAVYNLFAMFAKMGGHLLEFQHTQTAASGPDIAALPDHGANETFHISGIAAQSEDGAIQIMVYSHHDDWDITAESEIELTIENIQSIPEMQVNHFRIDETHSNAYREWLNQGSPRFPQSGQYLKIKSKDGLEKLEDEKILPVKNGILSIRFTMPAHGVSLIEIAGVNLKP